MAEFVEHHGPTRKGERVELRKLECRRAGV